MLSRVVEFGARSDGGLIPNAASGGNDRSRPCSRAGRAPMIRNTPGLFNREEIRTRDKRRPVKARHCTRGRG